MTSFDLVTVDLNQTDSGIQRRNRSVVTTEQTAAGSAAQIIRSWRISGRPVQGRSGAPPRPVGVNT